MFHGVVYVYWYHVRQACSHGRTVGSRSRARLFDGRRVENVDEGLELDPTSGVEREKIERSPLTSPIQTFSRAMSGVSTIQQAKRARPGASFNGSISAKARFLRHHDAAALATAARALVACGQLLMSYLT